MNAFEDACYFLTGLGIWLATYGLGIAILLHLFGII